MTDGTIKVERCTSHVYVEWNMNVPFATFENRTHFSHTFEIGNQSYFLEFCADSYRCYLSLYREGPPDQRSMRWWAGLKRLDGSYYHREGFQDLSLENGCPSFIPFGQLKFHSRQCVMDFYELPSSCNISVYFQVEAEEVSSGTEKCTYESVEKMFPLSDGQIYEKECSCWKHVEWTLDYDSKRESCWVSPVFETGNQHFRLVFSMDYFEETLELFRLGSSVDPGTSVSCWVGLKHFDGPYHYRNRKHELLVKKEYRLWTPVLELMNVNCSEIARCHLDRNKRLTFFLRMTEGTGAEPCTVGRPQEFTHGVGSIKKEMLSPYMLVQWTFTVDKIQENSSPVIVVGNQYYVLEFSFADHCFAYVKLFRMGPFEDRDVRYWAALRRSDDLYEDFPGRGGKFHLRKAADMWSEERFSYLAPLRLGKERKELTFDFLLTYDESPAAVTLCVSTVSHAEEDLINSPERDPSFIVFKVEDMEFKIHKAVIQVCVPVFRRMFTHECVESKTGVMTIKDCKPIVFKEFLELVEGGFTEKPSVENALALYEVANKYLLYQLKIKCSEIITDNLSVYNICDFLGLCFAYEDKNLLFFARNFLWLNKEIIKSVSFSDVSSRYPEDMNRLMQTLYSI